jgi:hypothetical protein
MEVFLAVLQLLFQNAYPFCEVLGSIGLFLDLFVEAAASSLIFLQFLPQLFSKQLQFRAFLVF